MVLFPVLLVLGLQCLLFFSWPVRTANAFQIASLVILFLFSPSKLKPKSLCWIIPSTPPPKLTCGIWKNKVPSKTFTVICLACCYHYPSSIHFCCVDHWKNPQPATFDHQFRRRFLALLPRSTVGWHVTTSMQDSSVHEYMEYIGHHLAPLWCDVNIYFCMFCGSVICCILTWNLQITEFTRKILFFHSPPFSGSSC